MKLEKKFLSIETTGKLVNWVWDPLSGNLTKYSNILKQLVRNSSANCLSTFDRFVGLALKG